MNRIGTQITKDMDVLHDALWILLDETRPIQERINELRPEKDWGEHAMVPFLGMSVLTAILLVAHPEKYGVWNNTSAFGLKKLKLWDKSWDKIPGGDAYADMNSDFLTLSRCLGVDLWTLDALWWVMKKKPRNQVLAKD